MHNDKILLKLHSVIKAFPKIQLSHFQVLFSDSNFPPKLTLWCMDQSRYSSCFPSFKLKKLSKSTQIMYMSNKLYILFKDIIILNRPQVFDTKNI